MSSSPKRPGRRKPRKPASTGGARRGTASRAAKAGAKTRAKTKSKVGTKVRAKTKVKAKAKAKAKAGAKARAKRLRFVALDGERHSFPSRLPLLPLRDVVVFPGMIAPLLVGRPPSVAAIESALEAGPIFAVLTQQDAQVAEPGPDDLHGVGTVVRAAQVLRVPDGTLKILVEGIGRFRVKGFVPEGDHFAVDLEMAEEPAPNTTEVKALARGVTTLFQEYVELNRRLPDEVFQAAARLEDPRQLAQVVSGHVLVGLAERQKLLEATGVIEQLALLSQMLGDELEILRIERKIEGEVRSRVTKGQKEFYLQEQMKAIRKELGEPAEEGGDAGELREQVKAAQMPADVEEKALAEVDRLGRMSPMSPEATVVRGYVETLVSLPWNKRTKDRLDIDAASRILDEDHYGLEKPKERILEYLAVVQLVKRPRGSILCLVGPPGVGKTSLGRSIARSLGREFVRVSLGGVRDEAEIRGHRRTYIGSMPGRVIQGLRKAGTKNPVFLLDEVDKLSSDFRGDPSSALLEVLDPEQNRTFNDHYLDVDFDLSEVLFVTTANVLPAIPPALRDRMEVLRLPGYLEHEKMGIASQFLLKKQLAEHGLRKADLALSRPALRTLVTRYTREAGVRNLERELATICRKVAREKVRRGKGAKGPVRVGVGELEKFLGPPRFPERKLPAENRIGVASGLAWTEWGGDVLPVEVATVAGRGKIHLTGRLGEVMRESARTALTYARGRAAALGLTPDFADRIDLHLHMPEGAIPKDGPSAGVCILTAVISALSRVPVHRDVAMTGEITLLGKVLPIGGLNEKVVAASLAGYTTIIVPKANRPDWEEIPATARKGLEVVFAEHVDDVLGRALVSSPKVDRLLAASAEPPAEGLPGIAH